MESKKLSVYVKRGKAIPTGDMFDDSIAENIYFIQKHSSKAKASGVEEKQPESSGKKSKGGATKSSPPISPLHELDKRKKELESQKLQQEILKLELDLSKKSGQVIPTDLVKPLFQQHFKSFTVSFHQAIDNILVEIGKRKKLSLSELAELRGRMVAVINTAVANGVESSKKSVANVVSEYAAKRKQGERV